MDASPNLAAFAALAPSRGAAAPAKPQGRVGRPASDAPAGLPTAAGRPGGTALAAGAVVALAASARTRTGRRGRKRAGGAARAAAVARAAVATESSGVVAVVGHDGCGKSKVCAALLELADGDRQPAESPKFADKRRLLARESAEQRRNFTCYNHMYSQQSNAEAYDEFAPRLHLIDTPGHVDRLSHVDHALHVAHGAVVVCSVTGTNNTADGRIMAAVEQSGRPTILFLNGVDKTDDAFDFEVALDNVSQQLGAPPAVLYAPVYNEKQLLLLNVVDGTVCAADECYLMADTDDVFPNPVPGAVAEYAAQLRKQLVETVATADEAVMESFLEQEGEVPRQLLLDGLRRGALAGSLTPLVAGSAKTGLGIDALQEAIQSFVSVRDGDLLMEEIGVNPVGGASPSVTGPFLGWAFGQRKEGDQRLLEVRVVSGTVSPGQSLKLVSAGAEGEAFAPVTLKELGDKGDLVEAAVAGPGDIILVPIPTSAAADLKPGERVVPCAISDAKRPFAPGSPERARSGGRRGAARRGRTTFALRLDSVPDKKGREQLLGALGKLAEEDDGLRLEKSETGETLLSVMGMLHLELLRERLAEDFRVLTLPLEEPYVAFRATLRGGAAAAGVHAPAGKTRIRKGTAHVHNPDPDAVAKVELNPAARGAGVVFKEGKDLEASTELRAALESGAREGLRTAGPRGIPITDVSVTLLSVQAKDPAGVAAAAASAVQLAAKEAKSATLLEPVMEVEIQVPDRSASTVVSDLEKRHGEQIFTRESEAQTTTIEAEVPLRRMLGYWKDIHKMTSGEGSFTLRLKGYREVDASSERQILDNELAAA